MNLDIDVAVGESKTVKLQEGELSIGRDGLLWYFSYLPASVADGLRPEAFGLSATVSARSPSARLTVRNRLPALPIMFKFPEPISMIPDSSILLGFSLFLDLCVEDSSGACLWSFTHPGLGRAWYGGQDSGEECLCTQTLPLPIKRELDALGGASSAGIPVRLRNETKRRIDIPRVTVPTSRLRLYRRGTAYVCDPTLLTYEPDEDIRLSAADLRAIEPGESLVVIDQARQSQADQLIKKGMHLLRGLAAWGEYR